MTLAWMTHSVVVSLLAGAGAAAAERGLRLYDLPARGVWVAAMAASVGLPLAAWLGAVPPDPVAALPAPGVVEAVSGAAGGHAAGEGGLMSLDAALAWGWALAAATGLSWLGLSALRLRRSLDRTPTRSVGGVDVHLTSAEGPACWSLPGGRARVLLPSWIRELDADRRRLAVAHERQHLRRGDPLLVAAGCLLAAAVPWNLPLWWKLGRLRRALELDCDARVLGSGADPRSYGELLLSVGERAGGAAWSALPLSEGAARLERRIRAITAPPREHRVLEAGALALAALLAGALAGNTAPPGTPAGGESDAARAAGEEPGERPRFVPFSVAPELQNPGETSRRLRELYPDSLHRAGIGGTVILEIYVDRSGRVERSRVAESSGHEALDRAAREVAGGMEFSPALNRDQPRAVWIRQRIRFEPSEREPPSAPGGRDR